MKKRYWFLSCLLIISIAYFLGPPMPAPSYSDVLPILPKDLNALENYVGESEKALPGRKDNQARILWQNDTVDITEYSIVYLHGFGGSYRDGYPVNLRIADTLNANIYLSRWASHGLTPPFSLNGFTPESSWNSAKEALVIGETIGKKVIILSTSTGGTLAIKLAATYPEKIFAIINLSPNIEDDFDFAFLLNSPWGYELAHLVAGDYREIDHGSEIAGQYWDTIYPSGALVDLQVLLSTTMLKETFKKVKCPILTLYYYENFLDEDEHVEVEVYPEVHKMIATPDSIKKLVQLKTPKTHYIGSNLKSRDTQVVVK